MPVSKKRVKKDQRKSAPPAPKSLPTPAKKKLTTQQILIYVISVLIILSMAIVGLTGTGAPAQPTVTPSALETPASSDSAATATPQP